jgi:hypothetical protein
MFLFSDIGHFKSKMNRMDPDSFQKRFGGQRKRYRILAVCTSCENTATITYSRFRALFRCPVVQAQEKNVEKKNASVGVGSDVEKDKKVDDQSSVTLGNEDKNVQKSQTNYRSLMRMNANVVSKEDIFEHISKETGGERLKELFGRE